MGTSSLWPLCFPLQGGDFFVGGVIAGTLTKLMLRLKVLGALNGEWVSSLSGSALTGADHADAAEPFLVVRSMCKSVES